MNTFDVMVKIGALTEAINAILENADGDKEKEGYALILSDIMKDIIEKSKEN